MTIATAKATQNFFAQIKVRGKERRRRKKEKKRVKEIGEGVIEAVVSST